VYVTELPENLVDNEKLEELLSQFGKVSTARILKRETGEKDAEGNPILKSKGCAFALFDT